MRCARPATHETLSRDELQLAARCRHSSSRVLCGRLREQSRGGYRVGGTCRSCMAPRAVFRVCARSRPRRHRCARAAFATSDRPAIWTRRAMRAAASLRCWHRDSTPPGTPTSLRSTAHLLEGSSPPRRRARARAWRALQRGAAGSMPASRLNPSQSCCGCSTWTQAVPEGMPQRRQQCGGWRLRAQALVAVADRWRGDAVRSRQRSPRAKRARAASAGERRHRHRAAAAAAEHRTTAARSKRTMNVANGPRGDTRCSGFILAVATPHARSRW